MHDRASEFIAELSRYLAMDNGIQVEDGHFCFQIDEEYVHHQVIDENLLLQCSPLTNIGQHLPSELTIELLRSNAPECQNIGVALGGIPEDGVLTLMRRICIKHMSVTAYLEILHEMVVEVQTRRREINESLRSHTFVAKDRLIIPNQAAPTSQSSVLVAEVLAALGADALSYDQCGFAIWDDHEIRFQEISQGVVVFTPVFSADENLSDVAICEALAKDNLWLLDSRISSFWFDPADRTCFMGFSVCGELDKSVVEDALCRFWGDLTSWKPPAFFASTGIHANFV